MFIFLLFISVFADHNCVHDRFQSQVNLSTQFVNYPNPKKNRNLQDAFVFEPIRFHIDYTYLDNEPDLLCTKAGDNVYLSGGQNQVYKCSKSDIVTSAKRKYIVEQLMPVAQQYFQKMLQVVRVDGNLKLQSNGKFNPQNMNYVCSNIPAKYKDEGVANSDFVIFVTARPTEGSTLAWALTCAKDTYGRPISGQVNLGPARLTEDDPRAYSEQLGVTIHEITHSLGFSSSNWHGFYEYYRGPRRETVTIKTKEWKPMVKIVTPKVLEIAKEHYNCFDWPNAGIELEDYGGSGTAGSHWEKRVMYNEYMTGIASHNPVYSKFTFALFEDMGYYKVNWTVAEHLSFGKGKGCPFIQKSCKMWKEYPDYFCSKTTCSYDYKDKSICLISNQKIPLEEYFQYYDEPTKGGFDAAADYCPIPYPSGTGNCLDSGTDPTSQLTKVYESVGATSRCYTADTDFGLTPTCYISRCSNSKLEIYLNKKWHLLPNEAGGKEIIEGIPITYQPPSLLCPGIHKCPGSNDINTEVCSKHGYCMASGVCLCHQGFSGEGCDSRECPKGNSGDQCSNHGTCVDGQCQCEKKYSGSACELLDCPNSCTANTHGNCDHDSGICTCLGLFYGDDCAESYCPPYPYSNTSCNGDEYGICDKTNGVCVCNSVDNSTHTGYYDVKDNCTTFIEGNRYLNINMTGFGGEEHVVKGESRLSVYQFYEAVLTSAAYSVFIFVTKLNKDASIGLYATFLQIPPSAVKNQFSGTESGETVKITMIPGADGSAFTSAGKVRIGVIGLSETNTDYSISVKQDPCQDAEYKKCNGNGVCKDGQCVCQPGWKGSQCNVVKCDPDCEHGRCVNSNGKLQCECYGGFTGNTCADTDILFLETNKVAFGTPILLNNTDVGYYNPFEFVIEQSNGACEIKIELENEDISPVVLFKYNSIPTLSNYDIFQSDCWSVPKKQIRLLLDASTGLVTGKWYMVIYNSLYSSGTLSATVTFNFIDNTTAGFCENGGELVLGKTTPSCQCDANSFGSFCQNRFTIMEGNLAEVLQLNKGAYDFFRKPLNTKGVVSVTMIPVGGNPIMMVSTEQFPTLDSNGLIDFNSISNHHSSQTVKIAGVTGFLYITIHNKFTASTPVKVDLKISIELSANAIKSHKLLSLLQDSPVNCSGTNIQRSEEFDPTCYCHGKDIADTCSCTGGWTGSNCNTPVLRSVQTLMDSAQNLKYLCNRCEFSTYLRRSQFNIYRVPIPLRDNVELVIKAFAVDQTFQYANNSGNPDIYLTSENPRTMYDFTTVAAFSNSTEQITISPSDLKLYNKLYVAIYANDEAYYNISVTTIDHTQGKEDLFIFNELGDWMQTSTTGVLTIIFIAIFVAFPLCCLLGPICTRDKIEKIDLSTVVSSYLHSGSTRRTSQVTNNSIVIKGKKLKKRARQVSVIVEMVPFSIDNGATAIPYLYLLDGNYQVVNPPTIEILKNPVIPPQAESGIV